MKTKIKMSVPKARRILRLYKDYKLAEYLGVTKQCVSAWRKRGFISYKKAAAIQDGQIMEAGE
jgi:DNA-binding transcriptional regulator YiaG